MTTENETPSGRTANSSPKRRRAPRRSKWVAFLADSFPKVAKVLGLLRAWMKRRPLWIQIPLYALVALVALGYALRGVMVQLPVISSVREELWARVEDTFAVPLPRATGKLFAIGVTRFDDDDGTIGKMLDLAVSDLPVERLQIERRLRIADAANKNEAEDAARATTRRWAETMKADLVLWGRGFGGKEKGVRLFITLRHARLAKDDVRLPQAFLAYTFVEENQEFVEAAIRAQVLGFLAQYQSDHEVVAQLRAAVTKLEGIVLTRRDGPGRTGLVLALANAQATLGEQSGEDRPLATAVGRYRELLHRITPGTVPPELPMIHNNLGNALGILGKREAQPARLEEARESYAAAIASYDILGLSADWAMAQNNLGLVLETLGRREATTARLNEAVDAYQAALTKITRAKSPKEWSMLQNNLGNAFVALAEREPGSERLHQAVGIFRGALEIRTRPASPLGWAMTTVNLGNALGLLGEREKSAEWLRQSVAAYREALKEYVPERMPLDWAMAQNNLGTALGRLGERERDSALLREAVKAFRASLDQRDVTRSPLEWAMTQNNLGTTLVTLGTLEKNVAELDAAIARFEAALAAPGVKEARTYRDEFRGNLYRTQELRAELAGEAAR